MVDGDIEVLDDDFVSGVQDVEQEHVGVQAQVQSLPEVNLIDKALLPTSWPGVRPDNVSVLQIKQVEEFLLVWKLTDDTKYVHHFWPHQALTASSPS